MRFCKVLLILCTLALTVAGCTSEADFQKGKAQLEAQGYTNVHNTGWKNFCCGEDDTFSEGFTATDRFGNQVTGCFCSGAWKGVTIRFQ